MSKCKGCLDYNCTQCKSLEQEESDLGLIENLRKLYAFWVSDGSPVNAMWGGKILTATCPGECAGCPFGPADCNVLMHAFISPDEGPGVK